MDRKLQYSGLLAVTLVFLPVFTAGVTGQSLGPEFRVNPDNGNGANSPAIAFAGAGNVIVVWIGSDGDTAGVYGRRYDSALSALGTEFLVTTTTDDYLRFPDVAANASGDFVVAWQIETPDGFDYLGFRRYDGAGNPVGDETLISTYVGPWATTVVLTDEGHFEILCHIDYPGFAIGYGFYIGGYPCPTTLYQATDRFSFCKFVGNRAGDIVIIFRLDGYPRASHGSVCGYTDPDVPITSIGSPAMNSSGEVLIVWKNTRPDTADVVAQRYEANLSPVGGLLTVKSDVPGGVEHVNAALLDNGDFLVVWDELDGGPSSSRDLFARYYVAPDSFLEEFRVNENLDGDQSGAEVGASDDGRFLIVWNHVSDLHARGVWRVGTGVEAETPPVSKHVLNQNYPNPFAHNTVIQYRLAVPADVTIRIFDVQGKLITSIPQGYRTEGPHNAEWHGRDARGNPVSSGTYFYELKAGGKAITKKMIVLR